MCCAGSEWDQGEKPNGVCKECGTETLDEEAYENCYYSPTVCEECGWKPCDGSC